VETWGLGGVNNETTPGLMAAVWLVTPLTYPSHTAAVWLTWRLATRLALLLAKAHARPADACACN